MIAAGRLRHPVVIKAPGRPVPDGAGGHTDTYTTIVGGNTWGELVPASGSTERMVGERLRAVASHVLTVRYLVGVDEACRVFADGRTYAVRGVENRGGRDALLVLVLEEVRTS